MEQNIVKLYAKALAEVLSKKEVDEKIVVDNFLKLLIKEGQEQKACLRRQAKEILNLTEDLLLAKQGKSKITFETARRLTVENRASLKKFVKDGDIIKEKVNHELIAGVKIIINNSKQFDASMKSKLQNIF